MIIFVSILFYFINKLNTVRKLLTFILETASSACIILVDLVGCPSQTNCVEPKYRARNKTPSIKTVGSNKPNSKDHNKYLVFKDRQLI